MQRRMPFLLHDLRQPTGRASSSTVRWKMISSEMEDEFLTVFTNAVAVVALPYQLVSWSTILNIHVSCRGEPLAGSTRERGSVTGDCSVVCPKKMKVFRYNWPSHFKFLLDMLINPV